MTPVKSILAGAAAALVMSVGWSQALAGESALQAMFHDWVEESSDLVSSKMKGARFPALLGGDNCVQIFEVTVDASGQVQDYALLVRKGSRRFTNTSERMLDRLDSFPQLPRDYYSNELTFILALDYDGNKRMREAAWKSYRATRVEVHDLAGNGKAPQIVMLTSSARKR